MGKLRPGDRAPTFRLDTIYGRPFDLDALRGNRVMLSFYRFATCPLCNLRIHELIRWMERTNPDLQFVGVFDATVREMARTIDRHQPPFPLLADPENTAYEDYGIERSVPGMLKGMVTRLPQALRGMFVKGYLPLPASGSITTMPADFLIDEHGTIQAAYYGQDEGDHLDIELVERFAQEKS